MKLGDPFPSARAFSTLLCSISNKRRLQNLICRYLTDLAPRVDAEIIYSVGSNCTNLSTQQSMQNYSFDQSEADTVLFSAYAVLRESGYTGPVVIDATDTDAYVAAAFISQQALWHNDSSHGAKIAFLDLDEEVVEDLFEFTRHVIYGDHKSKTMAEARAKKWKSMQNKSFLRLPPDADSLRQHCLRANYLAYLVRQPSSKHHPALIGHGWELVDGRCRPVRHTQPVLSKYLPASSPSEASEEDESDYDDGKDDDKKWRYCLLKGDDSTRGSKTAKYVAAAIMPGIAGIIAVFVSAAVSTAVKDITDKLLLNSDVTQKINLQHRYDNDRLEQYTRRDNLRIFGIEEDSDEDSDFCKQRLSKLLLLLG
ncbi:hypothetical protein GWK47_047693 [Chionoecetes opilio]|uniref:Uncharacterized protein n=1 Tax=Chionoecetes opilio TaxID=41210 RepID=A0A8J5CV40_CHIOP|nr:hypothetical protein GWK47_047693 [Chionoecetes opilio]